MLWILLIMVIVGMITFVYVGVQMFSEAWEEEHQYENIESELDLLLLTIPPQHLTYLSFCAAFLGVIFVGAFLGTEFFRNIVGMVVIGMVFAIFPPFFVNLYRKHRQKAFGVQLVDALVALSNSLRAGFSLPKAVELLAEESPDPLRQEMRIVVQEMRLGEPLVTALRNLNKRMPNEDLDLLATAIDIAGEVGGNLSEIFDNIANTIRERHKIQGRIDALTSQGRLQGIVVGLLPLFLGVAINYIDPTLFRPMYTTPIGWGLIAVAIILELLGFWIIMKIVSIRV